MRRSVRFHRQCRHCFVAFSTLLLLVAFRAPALAADPPANLLLPAEAAVLVLDLDTCRQIALEKQPTLAAYRASLATSQAKVHALNSLNVPTLLRPDLPIRRCQAQIGLGIAQAQLMQQEWEVNYAVTRTYLTVLYAREQQRVARDFLQILQDLQETTKGLAGEKGSNVTVPQYERVRALREMAAGRQQETTSGVERAKAALREAMGLVPDARFDLPNGQLRANPAPITREQVIALALDRRGELEQAGGAAQVAALEVKAQAASRGRTAQTFAAGADIHSQPITQGLRDGEYRPGAVGPEMPIQLVGTRSHRVDQAHALGARADAVFEKAQGLVALEAEDVFYRYLDWESRSQGYRRAARIAEKRGADIRLGFDPRIVEKPRAILDDVLDGSLLSTQLLVQANEAEFRYLVTLADLERVTAGGFCPNYLPPSPATNGANGNGGAPAKPAPALVPQ